MPLPVMGVVYSQDRPAILLGNQILHEGETLGDITVKKVNPDMTVVLTQNGQDFVRSVDPASSQVAGTFPEGAGIQYGRTMTPEQDIAAQENWRTQRGIPMPPELAAAKGQFLPPLGEIPILDEKGQTTKLWQDSTKAMNDYIDKTYADDMAKAEMVEDPHLRTMFATQHLTDRGKIQAWKDEQFYKSGQINEYEKYDDEQKQEAYKQLREQMKAKAPFPEALASLPEPKLPPYDEAVGVVDKAHEAATSALGDQERLELEGIDRDINEQKTGLELQRQQIKDRLGRPLMSDSDPAFDKINDKIEMLEIDARRRKNKVSTDYQGEKVKVGYAFNEQRRKLGQIKSARLSPIDEQNAISNVVATYMPTIPRTAAAVRTPEETRALIQQIEKEADQYAPTGAQRTNFIRQRYHDLGLVMPTEAGGTTLFNLPGSIPKAGAPITPAAGTVQIKMPDGKLWNIPADKVNEAIRRGGKRV